MKRSIFPVILLLCAPSCWASDTYFAATSAGSNNGTSCANAYAYNDGTHGARSSWHVGLRCGSPSLRGIQRLGSSYYSSLASWQAACSCDANTLTSNPLVNSNGTLQAGSPAIGAGVNLTSLGITGLNSDANGVARPTSGAWDIGAYQYAAAPGFSMGSSFAIGGNGAVGP